jgi:hypothetical protein
MDSPAVPQIALLKELIEMPAKPEWQAESEGSSAICFDTLRGRVRRGGGGPEVSLRSPPATGFDPAGVIPATDERP